MSSVWEQFALTIDHDCLRSPVHINNFFLNIMQRLHATDYSFKVFCTLFYKCFDYFLVCFCAEQDI